MPQDALNAKKNLKKKRYNLVLPIIFFFIIDRAAKIILKDKLLHGETIQIIGDKIRLTLVYNKGAAFGIFQNSSFFLTVVSLVILISVFKILASLQKERSFLKYAFILIASGALGNIFDRLYYGYVVDFIDVDIPDIIPNFPRWPVFNFADAYITIGVIMVIIYLFFMKEEKIKNASGNN